MKAFPWAHAFAVLSIFSRFFAHMALRRGGACVLPLLVVLAVATPGWTQTSPATADRLPDPQSQAPRKLPPQMDRAQRFLAARGLNPGQVTARSLGRALTSNQPAQRTNATQCRPAVSAPLTAATANWQPIGPSAVSTPDFGLVTGRVTALAFDPADATGNRLYVGTTGGGVWLTENAGTSNLSYLAFLPRTDTLSAFSGALDSSISIGALTVQPGSTGVVLAGTGDPNDASDSYYGAGILRSTDSGNSWSLIQMTSDLSLGFVGEGFAGFAWSTASPQTVVAAVSRALEGTEVNALVSGLSYRGLYYSTDSGATWNLAIIQDLNGLQVQGPDNTVLGAEGNAATTVIWNPVRQIFIAAVRYHGYYQSVDGITWTRLAAQPGANLTTKNCPTQPGSLGSSQCPIFRGTLAVNPLTGDTFAWTVDGNNQDQGLWQDSCAASGGVCTNPAVAFAKQWDTTLLQSNTPQGTATIADGDYNLTLAAVPANQDTLLLAGDHDLWKCSLASQCAWRNTTNADTCKSAAVAEYQHALAWNPADPAEIFIGNDSGLWRSTDAVGETGQACDAGDATHFQNLNGSLGSLAEAESLVQSQSSPYVLMAGLGANGVAGVKDAAAPTGAWPRILSGQGGAVAIDPRNDQNWYANNAAGVAIHACSGAAACTPASFGASPAVTNADVAGDGEAMTSPAPFLVDPLDNTQLLVGTCRVWRGPATGGWKAGNAVSPILDGSSAASCNGNALGSALIHAMAAISLGNGKEWVYVGISGSLNGGGKLAGHVFSANIDATSSTTPTWTDLTAHPVSNDALGFNSFAMEISSIFIDGHDPSGQTVYVTVAGIAQPGMPIRTVYRSVDGGATWTTVIANLPRTPANSLVVDPQDANTVYVATDRGVYSTRTIQSCVSAPSNCWTSFGTGLPQAPVVALTASPVTATAQLLTAATYGRGIWQIPLWTAGTQPTLASVTAAPTTVTFASQPSGTKSAAQTVTLTNSSSANALTISAITLSGDFSESDNCVQISLEPGASCALQVSFTPTATGTRIGQAVIAANISGGSLPIALRGTGAAALPVNLSPASLAFGSVEVGQASSSLQVTATNSNSYPVAISSLTVTGPFALASNACGSTSLAASTACQMKLQFQPTQAGAASGTLTLVDAAGTQVVSLTGVGAAPPKDTVSPASLTFLGTILQQLSAPQTVEISNVGDLLMTGIAATISGPFQISSDCGTQLPGKSSCAVSVVFAPVTAGSQSGVLTINDAASPHTVSLAGLGLLKPVFSLSPASLSFADQPVNTPSAAQTVTVNNTGGAAMADVGFQVIGGSAGSFATGTTTCGTAAGSVLNAGSSCTVQVTFTPQTAGGNSATLVLSSSTFGVTAAQVPLIGNGTSTIGLNVNPPRIALPATATGQTSVAQSITITNQDSHTDANLALSVPAPFALTQNTCGSSLAAAASCSVGVTFAPLTSGAQTGLVSVVSPSASVQATVALNGTGALPPSLQATPAVLNFDPMGVGNSSAPATVTIANAGTLVSATGISLTASPGFQLTANTCAATLAAQASCTVGVEFTPSGTGAQAGTVSILSDSSKTPITVALSGAGVDFTVTPLGAISQTISSGQVANYSLTIAPLGGVQAVYVLQCGTLPAHALCAMSPASETISGGATGTAVVKLSTGQTLSATSKHEPNPRGTEAWRLLPMLCGLVVLPWACRMRQRAMLAGALLAILVGGVVSCTSSGGGTGGSGGAGNGSGVASTPAGTYSIPVSVSSNGITHSMTLTLIVD